MALTNCPECGTEVSDKAEKCPKCAFPLNPISNEFESGESKSNNYEQKIIFTNETFYWLLISFISILLIYNLLILIKYSNSVALSPVIIQIVLLASIFLNFRLVKRLIQFWVIIFLIIANGLVLLGALIQLAQGNFGSVKKPEVLFSLILLSIGIAILQYTNKTVLIPKEE